MNPTTGFQRARSPQQQEQRRAAILEAAREMLDDRGPHDVSLRELSGRIGLSKSNVVRYFPSREAVFLAVLVVDWGSWLDEFVDGLPRVDRRHSVRRRCVTFAAAVAESVVVHPRLCDLIAACQSVLEQNVPIETAREFKGAALVNLARLAEAARLQVPELGERAPYDFAGLTWSSIVGLWPMANPSPVVAQVLDEPAFASMRVDFVPALTRSLSTMLLGMVAAD